MNIFLYLPKSSAILLCMMLNTGALFSEKADLSNGVEPRALGVGSICEQKVFEGYFRFIKDDFKKRHKLMPWFMVNKALATRLKMTSSHYVQYITPDKMYKDKRSVSKVEKMDKKTWKFTRIENGEPISYTLSKMEEARWLYKEDNKEYELMKCTEDEIKRWKADLGS